MDSLAYGVYKQREKEESVLAFDFGGGFLSVSLITLENGLFEVWSNYSENHLGGDDLDNRLVDYCEKEFFSKTGLSFKNSQKALNRVRIECEKAKINLSSAKTAFIDIDSLMCGKDLYFEITRDKFEELCEDLFKKCIRVVEQVLKDGKRGKNEIDTILLAGGSSRIPKIQLMLQEFFYGKQLNKSIISKEPVATGAAIMAAIYTNVKDEVIEKLILLQVTSLSIGIETERGVMEVIIPRNSTLPTKKTKVLSINESSFLVKIYEGEGLLTKDNIFLGELFLEFIPPRPKGQEISITFDLDAFEVLNVIAEIDSIKLKKSICINRGLSIEKINQLKNKLEDNIKKENKQKDEKINKFVSSSLQAQKSIENPDSKIVNSTLEKVSDKKIISNGNTDINNNKNVPIESFETLKKELNKNKDKIVELEKKLKEEVQKNKSLEEKIKQLEKDNKILKENETKLKIGSNPDLKNNLAFEAFLKKDFEIADLKNKLARFPFILEEGEELMHINITSTEFNIQNYSIICKSTDVFNQIENKLYEGFPELKDIATYFIFNGQKINSNKTIIENCIKDNGVIIMNKLLDDD